MLGMRLCHGLSEAEIGSGGCVILDRYRSAGLVCKTGGRYAFTPEGMLVSNPILAELVDFSESDSVK